jgi:DNA-binding response OmpR family regulator
MTEPYSPREFTALLCCDGADLTAAATDQMTALGFAIETAETPEAALTALHHQLCDIVVVSESFGGADAFTNPVLSEINEFSQELRRSMFIVVLSPGRKTLAEMDAFSLSTDLILNPQDISRLQALVGQGLTRKEEFYRVFRAVEKQIQQEI